MEASSSRSRVRPMVVDFLATLFVTFCIGIATAVVLGVCVMLMAGEARGAGCERAATMHAAREGAPAEEARAKAIELALTHHLVTKYTSLIAIDRTPARSTDLDLETAALPAPLPEGWSYEAMQEADAAPGGQLPQGATNSHFKLLAGALMLLFATMLFRKMQPRPLARLLRRGRG